MGKTNRLNDGHILTHKKCSMKRYIFLLLCIISTSVYALDLVEAYQAALKNDALYHSAQAELKAGEQKRIQGRSLLLPSIEANGAYARSRDSLAMPLALSEKSFSTTPSYGFSLTQALYHPAHWHQYQQAKLQTKIAEIKFAQSQQDLILRVAQNYFKVLQAQDTLNSLELEKTLIAEQLKLAKAKFEAGTVTIIDTDEAQARYDLILAKAQTAMNDLELQRFTLSQMLGLSAEKIANLKFNAAVNLTESKNLNFWMNCAAEKNKNILQAKLNQEMLLQNVEYIRAGHKPTLDLVLSDQHNPSFMPQSIYPHLRQTSSVALQWRFPIFKGFSIVSQVDEALALVDKGKADLQNIQRVTAQQTQQAYLGVSGGLLQVKALESAKHSNQTALDSTKLSYQVGVRTHIDLLNAQQQLFSIERDLAKARYDTLLNELELKASAGILSAADLYDI